MIGDFVHWRSALTQTDSELQFAELVDVTPGNPSRTSCACDETSKYRNLPSSATRSPMKSGIGSRSPGRSPDDSAQTTAVYLGRNPVLLERHGIILCLSWRERHHGYAVLAGERQEAGPAPEEPNRRQPEEENAHEQQELRRIARRNEGKVSGHIGLCSEALPVRAGERFSCIVTDNHQFSRWSCPQTP